MKLLKNGLLLLCMALLYGCAHNISIAPDTAKLAANSAQPSMGKSVGYFISEPNKALRVVTPAGGGDSVEYAPYADFEAGLAKVLTNVFGSAHAVKDLKDDAFLQKNGIVFVFTPTLKTDSSSRNAFFWPPTDFSVSIDCVATNGQQQVWQTSIKAASDVVPVKEVIQDHGLTGKLAMQKALQQLQAQLQAAPELKR